MKSILTRSLVSLIVFTVFQSSSIRAQQHKNTNEISGLYNLMIEMLTDFPADISDLGNKYSAPFTQTSSKSFYLGYPLYTDVDYSKISDHWRGSITSTPTTESVNLHNTNLIHCQRIGKPTQKAIMERKNQGSGNIFPKGFIDDLGHIPDEAIAMQLCIIRKTITWNETREELYSELVAAIGHDLKLQPLTTDQQEMADRYPENFSIYYGNGPFHKKGAIVTYLSAVIGQNQPDTNVTQIWLQAVSYLLPPAS